MEVYVSIRPGELEEKMLARASNFCRLTANSEKENGFKQYWFMPYDGNCTYNFTSWLKKNKIVYEIV